MRAIIVGLAAMLFSTAAVAEPVWQVEREIDELRDSTNVIAGAPPKSGHSADALLAARCQKDNFAVFLMANEYLGTGSDFATVRYRFDQGDIQETTWSMSSNRKGAFAQEPKLMAKKLAQYYQVVIEIDATNSSASYQWVFSLDGSAEAISEVRKACDVERPSSDSLTKATERVRSAALSAYEAAENAISASQDDQDNASRLNKIADEKISKVADAHNEYAGIIKVTYKAIKRDPNGDHKVSLDMLLDSTAVVEEVLSKLDSITKERKEADSVEVRMIDFYAGAAERNVKRMKELQQD